MIGFKWIGLMIMSSILVAVPDNLTRNYKQGLFAYQSGKFEQAVTAFEKILDNNWESSELYYNLGNAYYRHKNTAGAVWAYEQSLLNDPSNEDARFNLKLANVNVKDRIDMPEAPLYLKLYLSLKGEFTSGQWLNISFLLMLIFSICVLIRKLWAIHILSILENIFLVALSLCFFLTVHSLWSDGNISEGIIYKDMVNVHSEPNSSATILFKVHEGLKVAIVESSRNWVEVELIDGKSGWVNSIEIRGIR